MTDLGPGLEKYKMGLEHLAVAGSPDVLKE